MNHQRSNSKRTARRQMRKLMRKLMRSPTAWLGAILLASIIPAAWDAYRAHTIGWVGAIDNTQDRLDEIEQYDGDWSRKYPLSFDVSPYKPGEEMDVDAGCIIYVTVEDGRFVYVDDDPVVTQQYKASVDQRVFVGRSYRANGMIVEPRLETMSIAEFMHITRSSLDPLPEIELLEPPYPEWLMVDIEQKLGWELELQMLLELLIKNLNPNPSSARFLSAIRHDGVMEPRAIHNEDGQVQYNDAGELERTPEHVFAFYRLTDGTLGSPISWDRFWVQAWGVLMWTMPMAMAAYVIGYIGYLSVFCPIRMRRRVEQGLCIKCAYPMQPNRAGEGLICTECGYLDHADTLSA